jgi:hypothetical protein
MKTPCSKLQVLTDHQVSNPDSVCERADLELGAWDLDFIWNLELGVWIL